MRLVLIALLVCSGVVRTAHAKCENTSTQMEMSECVGKALQKDDGALNALYGQIQRRLKPEPDTAKLFTSTQRAWVSFRDAECNFATSLSVGGTIHPMMVNMCMDQMTLKRIEEFEGYLKCGDGDMSCPVVEPAQREGLAAAPAR